VGKEEEGERIDERGHLQGTAQSIKRKEINFL
jgi:hypothetical protein